ncbi:MAG: serine hydrolase domain-containing protein [Pseudonocardiaceae bacterium]
MTAPTTGSGGELRRRVQTLLDEQVHVGSTRGAQALVHVGDREPIRVATGRFAQSDHPVTDDTRFCVYSISKTVVATAIHLLAEDGHLRVSDQVSHHLPRFGGDHRDEVAHRVTIGHLLSHRAGVPDVDETVTVHDYLRWHTAIDKICALPVTDSFGRFEYHKLTAYALLAEIVARVSGREFTTFAAERIFIPLGMRQTSWGLQDHLVDGATEIRGVSAETDRKNFVWRRPEIRRSFQPSMGLYSTATDLARLFGAWLRARAGHDSPLAVGCAAAQLATSIHARIGQAKEFGCGMGFMVGRDPVEATSRGVRCSPSTFGHPGRGTAIAYADPATSLVAVLLLNTDIGQPAADRRFGKAADLINDFVR